MILDVMAITGVPKVLDNSIVSILESHSVSNWSIFGEIDGSVSIKIRFKANGEGQGTSDIQHISYKRKSEKQVNRDRQRVKRKRVISSEAEISIEAARQGETSLRDNVLDNNQCSPFTIEPNDLPPVTEERQHVDNLDFQNLQNSIDATLSDFETSLNSTSVTATTFDVPEDLFLGDDDVAETVNSVPEPKAEVSDHPKAEVSDPSPEFINILNHLEIDQNFLDIVRSDFQEYKRDVLRRHPRHPPPEQ